MIFGIVAFIICKNVPNNCQSLFSCRLFEYLENGWQGPQPTRILISTLLNILFISEILISFTSFKMYLDSYHPGVSLDEIRENTGFDMDFARARETEKPKKDEVKILRKEIDPRGVLD